MWSYSNNPASSSKDAVRFLIQDVNTSKQLVQDEEIEWAVDQEANIYMAAARVCRTLVLKAGGQKRKRISDFDISYDPTMYATLAGSLEARGAGHQLPYCGGISIGDKLAQQSDTDAVSPSFAKNLDNNASAPSPATPPVGNNSNPLTTI